jgi:hypothetical protein
MQLTYENKKIIDAEYAAKIFKYHLQFKNPYIKFLLHFNRVQAKTFYAKYKKEFDKFIVIFNKYNLDAYKYIRFFIEVLNKNETDIKKDFITINTINEYVDWLKHIDKQNRIYKYFIKSANNIVNECNKLGFFSTKDFIRYMITNKKISEYYISGKISLYYFAAIPNFKKIIPKLDSFAKDEFQKVYDRFEMYNAEITSAFMKITNQKVNPIKFTDNLIYKTNLNKNK